jgi:hypothetical protein
MSFAARVLLLAVGTVAAVVALALAIPWLTKLGPADRPVAPASNTSQREAGPRETSRPLHAHGGVDVFAENGEGALVTTVLWAVAVGSLPCMALWHVVRRLRARRRREYLAYRLRLSMHDHAEPQELETMAELVANAVRSLPSEYVLGGQRFVALESHYGCTRSGHEWTPMVRCVAADVAQIEAAFQGAYPDVRLGGGAAQAPAEGRLPVPGYVMRFRKRRGFVYPIVDLDGEAVPLLEQVAGAQAALGRPSSVRFQLTPAARWIETVARSAYRGAENRLARQEHQGPRAAGLRGTLNRDELRGAQLTQNRGLLWLECVVAAATREDCRRVAAALQGQRAANRLQRRLMPLRQGLYRRRFPLAGPPLVPSLRCLISTAEAARLLELPSARMKGVAVERQALPRLPAPPQAARATDHGPPQLPDDRLPAFTAASR